MNQNRIIQRQTLFYLRFVFNPSEKCLHHFVHRFLQNIVGAFSKTEHEFGALWSTFTCFGHTYRSYPQNKSHFCFDFSVLFCRIVRNSRQLSLNVVTQVKNRLFFEIKPFEKFIKHHCT